MPEDIPERFEIGELLSSAALNRLQELILQRLADHDHTGGDLAEPLGTDGYTDLSVTEPKLADGAISARTVAPGAITADGLADGAVILGKIAADAVGRDNIVDGAVTEDKLSPAVRALLGRTGNGASSASQVIWRDPIFVYPIDTGISIVDGIIDPTVWTWFPPVVSLDENNIPIKFNPNRDPDLTTIPVDFDDQRPGRAELEVFLNDAVTDTAISVIGVGAAGLPAGVINTGGGARGGIAGQPTGTFGTGTIGTGGFIGGGVSGHNVVFGGGNRGALAGNVGAGTFAAGNVGAGTPAAGNLGAAGPAGGAFAGGPGAGALFREGIARTEGRSIGTEGVFFGGQEGPGMATGGGFAINEAGQTAAKRMLAIATVDAEGRPVEADDDNAIVVSSGFAGKETFAGDNGVADFRALDGSSGAALDAAARSAGKTLFNLGIDNEYLGGIDGTDNVQAQVDLALAGDRRFFDDDQPLWGGVSILPDIFNLPELLGTGYSLSGGRNVLSVTREFQTGEVFETWVRVRFVTPYRNSAYAVTVTPRVNSRYEMITANIRAKATAYVDISFTGLRQTPTAGLQFEQTSKLSFDLAVFGELGAPTR
ncbi:hypothetical protein [Yoonia sp. SS1-5]|uniref:Uncharacterized protein n=1 Tax=Yoonia rhodophyticola TaxID=3137370 RepID=A0AAN0MBY2_9RHOB